MSFNTYIRADSFTIPNWPRPGFICTDPVYGQSSINEALELIMRIRGESECAVACFMYPEDLCGIAYEPDQVVHWVKSVSTKNTARRYSRFVEAIALWHGPYFNKDLHWSTRTGVFTDTLCKKSDHPWKKPYSLIEKLVLLHTPKDGLVIDPFAGSGTTDHVCRNLGLNSFCVEKDDWGQHEYDKWSQAGEKDG